MTLDCEQNACGSTMHPTAEQEGSAVGLALREVVWQAQEQGRLSCGVVECAQILEIDPQNVMMCVMPSVLPDDVSAVIQLTLIEACCREYQIRLIKVDCVTKLAKVLQGRAEPSSGLPPKPSWVPMNMDMSCVLVQYRASGEVSPEEETLEQHCQTASCNDNFSPCIALPD